MPSPTTQTPLKLQQVDLIQSTLDFEDLIDNLNDSLDDAGRIKPLGQTPGSLEFYGAVDKNFSFWIRRKSSTLNPFARTCRGRILRKPNGAYLEYYFEKSIFSRCMGTSITMLSLICAGTLLGATLDAMTSQSLNSAVPGTAFVILLIAILVQKAGKNASYSTDEAILDHIRKVASGSR
ncbi:MAG: hypothetical protein K2Z81_25280 [Cyanobacteria bacterium]|nr:hypothetical protein [Cyanobacteriota bacterium]